MFEKRRTSLFAKTGVATHVAAGTSAFVKAGLKRAAKTTSLGNGAVKYTTTGNNFVDQFGKVTNYKAPRSFEEISKDMQLLWSQNPLATIIFTLYLRLITRVVSFLNGVKTSTTQRGQGLKHEGIFRMIWLALNAPESFQKNLHLFISVGSWKDVITMLQYDLIYNGWEGRKLDWNFIGKFLVAGLENPKTNNLVKKYLPQIKAKSACKTIDAQADNMIAKWICSLLFGTEEHDVASRKANDYKKYRKLKTSGTAHEWQKAISKGKMLEINFDTVAGRALAQLVSGKFLAKNGLEAQYEKWISTKPVAKYTGYVYELLSPVKSSYINKPIKAYQKDTINKQFYGLIETAKNGMKKGENGLLVVVDSSSSMTRLVPGTKVSTYDVAKSMALYFSYLLEGKFEKAWMEFNDRAQLNHWTGKTPVDNLQNDRAEAYGSTDFQSVAKLFGKLLKDGVPEKEFPTGILCVSDGCFNSAGSNKSNTVALRESLLKSGFSKEFVKNFRIVLWDIPNSHYGKPQTAFEDFADCPNLFHLSGLDGSVIAFLTGTTASTKPLPKTSEELFESAMDQEVFSLVQV